MSVPEKEMVRDSKSGDYSPSPHSDLEIGSVVIADEVSKSGDEALRFLKSQHAVGELTAAEEKNWFERLTG